MEQIGQFCSSTG